MQRFRLFAARDGDVIEEVILARDDEEARVIAAHRIVEEFRLQLDTRDFDEVAAETDGAILDLAWDEEISDLALEWASAQISFANAVKSRIDSSLRPAVKACSTAILALMMAIQDRQAQGPR